MGDDLRLLFMELGIQHVVLDPLFFEQAAQFLGHINGDRTYEHWLSLGVGCRDVLNNRPHLLLLRLIDGIFVVNTHNRFVGRDDYNVHAVDLTEFLFLGLGCTGHTGFLIIFIEEILECDSSEGLGLSLNLHAFFRLDRLMKSV